MSPWKGRRIVVLCEGDTEELATRHFITRQWQTDGLSAIGLHTVNLSAKLQDVSVKTSLYLDETNVLAVFTLVDLYGMDRVVHQADDELEAKVARVKSWFLGGIEHARKANFHPHVCVHETEAWMLAEGAALRRRLDDAGIKPDPQAEIKNFQSPPQRRLNELFLRQKKDRYHKIRDGRPLLAALEFDVVYKSCRYFRAFYDDLRSVGRNST
jgi:hypothetical protein